jgi:hypothetical protein
MSDHNVRMVLSSDMHVNILNTLMVYNIDTGFYVTGSTLQKFRFNAHFRKLKVKMEGKTCNVIFHKLCNCRKF